MILRRCAASLSFVLFCSAVGVGVISGGVGAAATQSPAPQIVTVEMSAISFKPNKIVVKAGRPVTFKFVNKNNLVHEAFVGNMDAQVKHDKDMKAGRDHTAHMGKGYVMVKPGETKSLTYTFKQRGRTVLGCHQPGHWKSGMRIQVVVM